MAHYTTANGERRTVVSVTLDEDQLWDLDQLAKALDAEWIAKAETDTEEEYRRRTIKARPRKRADALREAIRRTLDGIG